MTSCGIAPTKLYAGEPHLLFKGAESTANSARFHHTGRNMGDQQGAGGAVSATLGVCYVSRLQASGFGMLSFTQESLEC
jgi:hypothetical protein